MEYILSALLILSLATVSFGLEVNVVHEWKYCEYEWNNQEQKENAINSGIYDPYKCLFFDAIKAEDGRVFITIPKDILLLPGFNSPASLAVVTNKTGPGGPLLRPYPNWNWYNNNNTCERIVNVYRVHNFYIHFRYNVITFLDNGKFERNQICNPKLLIFDLKDDTLVKTIYIPLDIATDKTGSGVLLAPLIYVPGECSRFLKEMIIFIADAKDNGIIVYDLSTKFMCRVESDYMKPTDTYLTIGNKSFPYQYGIFGMTILHDELYYNALSRYEIYKIKIKTLLECPNKEKANKEIKLVTKLSKSTAEVASAGYSIFYHDSEALSILGTNVHENSNKTTILLAQGENFHALGSMKVSYYWNQLIGLSDKVDRFVLGTVNLDEIHFRYFEIKLSDILKKMDWHF